MEDLVAVAVLVVLVLCMSDRMAGVTLVLAGMAGAIWLAIALLMHPALLVFFGVPILFLRWWQRPPGQVEE